MIAAAFALSLTALLISAITLGIVIRRAVHRPRGVRVVRLPEGFVPPSASLTPPRPTILCSDPACVLRRFKHSHPEGWPEHDSYRGLGLGCSCQIVRGVPVRDDEHAPFCARGQEIRNQDAARNRTLFE